jgi:protein tyrosine/serine phosphatase
MRLSRKSRIVLIAALVVAAGAAGYQVYLAILHRAGYLNFGVVVPGKIYRSRQIGSGDLTDLANKYGIKTIVCLRGKENPDVKTAARKLGIKVVGVQMTASRPPEPKQMELIMSVLSGSTIKPADYSSVLKDQVGIDQPEMKIPGPFLIHCMQGADRTGYIVAVWRICFEGWSQDRARFEMLRYYHLPLRFPLLWKELKNIEPEKYCPSINPGYKPPANKP